jgi:vacuolar-type H+-ATPase subunit E/Vma4
VALADIIRRIEQDAADGSGRIIAEAQERADALIAEARVKAESQYAARIESARRMAESRAATKVASARLIARDGALAAKRRLVDESLERVLASLAEMPMDDYARMLAATIADRARDGDTVRFASTDSAVARSVRDAVAVDAPDLSVEWSEEPASIDRGAVLEGRRTRLEVSPRSLIEERRDQLVHVLAGLLFGEEEA